MASTAWTTACRPEPQTRFTVSPGTSTGIPAFRAACRATFIPAPACNTQPSTTSATSAGATFARTTASRTVTAPRSAADRSFRAPPNDPKGVRHALRMTTSKSLFKRPYLIGDDEIRSGGGFHRIKRHANGGLAQHQSSRRDVDDRHLGDDHVDDFQS